MGLRHDEVKCPAGYRRSAGPALPSVTAGPSLHPSCVAGVSGQRPGLGRQRLAEPGRQAPGEAAPAQRGSRWACFLLSGFVGPAGLAPSVHAAHLSLTGLGAPLLIHAPPGRRARMQYLRPGRYRRPAELRCFGKSTPACVWSANLTGAAHRHPMRTAGRRICRRLRLLAFSLGW